MRVVRIIDLIMYGLGLGQARVLPKLETFIWPGSFWDEKKITKNCGLMIRFQGQIQMALNSKGPTTTRLY
jgi:hypothetical protein